MARIRITTARPFVVEGGRQYAKGIWDNIPDAIAQQLIDEGRAVLVEDKPKAESKKQDAPSDIPPDFPARAHLVANGITTIEQLKSEGIKERIDAISGIGPKTMEDVESAIANL